MGFSLEEFYAILDLNACPDYRSALENWYAGGGRLLQLRAKNWDKIDVSVVAKEIAEFRKNHPFSFIINDYPEIAMDVNANGVHVGSNDSAPEIIKKDFPDLIVGLSTHSLKEIKEAQNSEADYLAFGAIFESPSKGHAHPVQGISKLNEVVKISKKPLVAIGGISKENINEVLKTGVESIAMINAWCKAKDIKGEVNWWVNRLKKKQ